MKKTKSISNKRYLMYSIVFYSISSINSIISSLLLGKLMDEANSGKLNSFLLYSLITIILVLLDIACMKIGIFFRMMFVKNKSVELRSKVISSLFKMPIRKFLQNDESFYMNVLTNDIDRIREDKYRSVPLIIFYFIRLLCAFIAMISINPTILITFILSFAFMASVPQLFTKKMKKLQTESSISNEEYMFNLKDIIQGIETLKLNHAITSYEMKFNCISKEQLEKYRKISDLKLFVEAVSNSTEFTGQLISNTVGGILVILGKASVGDLVVVMQLGNYAFQAIRVISEKYVSLRSVRSLELKVQEVINEGNNISKIHGNDLPITDNNYNVLFDHVTLSFDDRVILKDFSYLFISGKTYGIIGPSGSGKTTIAKLMLKYYNNYTGNIFFNNLDIRRHSEFTLVQKIKYVSQTPYMFNDTIYNNIVLGKDFSKNKVASVLRLTNLYDLFLRYKDQSIGDNGNRVSGGEKQRIALARALLDDPAIIIFDEPTSALDPVNADAIMNTIFSLNGITRIVITHNHDINLLNRFDHIIEVRPIQ